jgi:hypothetical protein
VSTLRPLRAANGGSPPRGAPRAEQPTAVEFVVDGDVVGTAQAPYRLLAAPGPGDHEVYARPVDPEAGVAFEGVTFSVW